MRDRTKDAKGCFMFKILIGNVLFIGVLAGWYFYADGDRNLLLPGVVLAFAAFICGIVMGYILHTPRKLPAGSVRRMDRTGIYRAFAIGSARNGSAFGRRRADCRGRSPAGVGSFAGPHCDNTSRARRGGESVCSPGTCPRRTTQCVSGKLFAFH